MIGEKHELKAIPKRRGNNGKRSRHGHGCPSPRDIMLPPIRGAKRTKGCGRGRKSDGITKIFRCNPHLGLKNNKQNFIFDASRDWKPMEMFLDVVGDMGVTGKSGNESCRYSRADTYTYICMCVYVCMYVCMYVCVCVCVCIHVYVCMYACITYWGELSGREMSYPKREGE